MLWVLMGTIAIVLVIACANVANLVLVRAQDRQQELAIRAALGAGRGRLVRQLLVENLVLGLLGGASGLLLALAGLRVFSTIGAASIPRLREITLDPTVLAFALGLSLASVLVFGGIPLGTLGSRRRSPMLRADGRGSSDSRERNRARDVLVVVQVALALILLVGSGLMVRTFLSLRAVPPGFTDPGHVQLARVTLPVEQTADPERVVRLQREMVERLATIPGVTDASFTSNVPLAGERSRNAIYREDVPLGDQGEPPARWFRFVAPGFFRTIGTRLVAGRDFTWHDLEGRRPVVVISENLARELWREPRAALGQRIREGDGSPWPTTACTARRRPSCTGRRSWSRSGVGRSAYVASSPLRSGANAPEARACSRRFVAPSRASRPTCRSRACARSATSTAARWPRARSRSSCWSWRRPWP
jgi:putative ABC transport system permease protein